VAKWPDTLDFARRSWLGAIFAPSGSARARSSRVRMSGQDDRGVTSIEYALLAALIAVVISGAVTVFGLSVNNLFLQIVGAF
jgi:pilus assembly protein Flp/PilA